jgi:hypothetical protein
MEVSTKSQEHGPQYARYRRSKCDSGHGTPEKKSGLTAYFFFFNCASTSLAITPAVLTATFSSAGEQPNFFDQYSTSYASFTLTRVLS